MEKIKGVNFLMLYGELIVDCDEVEKTYTFTINNNFFILHSWYHNITEIEKFIENTYNVINDLYIYYQINNYVN